MGVVEYAAGWRLQEAVLEARASGALNHDVVLLLEHPHVYTLGRRGRRENILTTRDLDGGEIPVFDVNRGGDITYHGPGQLVAYPVVTLADFGDDVGELLLAREQTRVVVGLKCDAGGRTRQR